MRIDGLPTSSYPIKRKPRKAAARVEDDIEDVEGPFEAVAEPVVRPRTSGGGNVSSLPARQQDVLFQRAMSRSAAHALASYMTTSTYVDWDLEVLGLDVHI
ncbi:hypothetical protein [Pseudomonas sp. dw_358]|uniref:hypothetical protein n=1 Tax=Pseudomonas sp. dw_358 TaxID=2720083 RepID=UPI001BD4E90A|nr:hypothetical protein [Pseudomonas sp. dw_358]